MNPSNRLSNNNAAAAAAPPPHNSQQQNNIRPARTLQGVWKKDFKASDMASLRSAVEAMQLSKVQARFVFTFPLWSSLAFLAPRTSLRIEKLNYHAPCIKNHRKWRLST